MHYASHSHTGSVHKQVVVAHIDLSNNDIEDDAELRNAFVRLVIERPVVVSIELTGNPIHADEITMLCNLNDRLSANSPCHCLCAKLAHT